MTRLVRRAFVCGGLSALGVAGALAVLIPRATAAPVVVRGASEATSAAPAVLVELFTSEGCSSCPPADAVLERLARSQPVHSARIVVLAHHVDYWDPLGWPDPFSSTAATARQRAYAPLRSGAHTPQAVVDGRAEMVGSREHAMEQAIVDSAKRPHASVAITVAPATEAAGRADVAVTVGPLPDGAARDAEVLIAVVQDRARVEIPRGENGGRTLEHVAMARSLESLGGVQANGGSRSTRVAVPRAIGAPDGTTFSVVAFVQERASRIVHGAAAAALASR